MGRQHLFLKMMFLKPFLPVGKIDFITGPLRRGFSNIGDCFGCLSKSIDGVVIDLVNPYALIKSQNFQGLN